MPHAEKERDGYSITARFEWRPRASEKARVKPQVAREASVAALAQRTMETPRAAPVAKVLHEKLVQGEVMRVHDERFGRKNQLVSALMPAGTEITILRGDGKVRIERADPNESGSGRCEIVGRKEARRTIRVVMRVSEIVNELTGHGKWIGLQSVLYLSAHHAFARGIEIFGERTQPLGRRATVIIGKCHDATTSFGDAAIARRGRAPLSLADHPRMQLLREASDNVVQRFAASIIDHNHFKVVVRIRLLRK